ncbi:hypothetical protein [Lacunisphaera limnophila]|uniref:hypothetical protein n=1 Tax=Lacunisphaera limnophila TaxID=1838286 RepID=UPI0012FD7C56|nr:hypothetical protein [Lacunisphaera limnophila]
MSAADIPVRFKDWSAIIQFAATFYPQVEIPAGSKIRGIADITPGSSILDIRAALFFEYRRYNHFGFLPPEDVQKQCLEGIELLRSKTG